MKESKGTYPAPSVGDYVADDLQITEMDYENGMSVRERFEARASIEEGVSGRAMIDTTYENFSEDFVDEPRSEWEDDIELRGMSVKDSTVRRPAPVDFGQGRYPHRRY